MGRLAGKAGFVEAPAAVRRGDRYEEVVRGMRNAEQPCRELEVQAAAIRGPVGEDVALRLPCEPTAGELRTHCGGKAQVVHGEESALAPTATQNPFQFKIRRRPLHERVRV